RSSLGPVFVVAGIALVPWAVYLVVTLPGRHVQTRYYDVAWGGFDVALALVLVLTGVGLLVGAGWVQAAAIAAATMLVCDAWFDVLTSTEGDERLVAILFAVLIELPVAVVCVLIARDAELAERRSLTQQREW